VSTAANPGSEETSANATQDKKRRRGPAPRPDSQAWKVETFISVVKRRFGGAVTARGYWQQVKQTLLRGITYNLYRAVQLGLSVHRMSHRLFKAAA
jgi:hypothetical protein